MVQVIRMPKWGASHPLAGHEEAMLGLGDIIIPALSLAMFWRFDLAAGSCPAPSAQRAVHDLGVLVCGLARILVALCGCLHSTNKRCAAAVDARTQLPV